VRAGKVVPAIDRQYPMSEAAAAMSHFAEGHARAKVVVTVAP
jgi:NADPH:quinone reductase-like Zn-dependent oxidoreductase